MLAYNPKSETIEVELLDKDFNRTGRTLSVPANTSAENWDGGVPNSRVHCRECGAEIPPGKPNRRCPLCRKAG